MDKEFMTVQQIASELGLTRQRVDQLMRQHSIRSELISTRMRLVPRAEFLRLCNERRPGSVQQQEGDNEDSE